MVVTAGREAAVSQRRGPRSGQVVSVLRHGGWPPGPRPWSCRGCGLARSREWSRSRSLGLRVGVQLAALVLQDAAEHLEAVVEVWPSVDTETRAQGAIR